MSRIVLSTAILGLLALPCSAAGSLFFMEIQALAGYDFGRREAVFYSHHPDEAMQKPGLGFDFIHRFSGKGGDFGMLALQARLALKKGHGGRTELEPQVYNAYFKLKARFADLWIGHSRPAFGLSSVLDSHALLLQPLTMSGFGFDRDWGIGLYRMTDRGDWAFSLTTGSGMPLRLEGNYLLSGRVSRGIAASDNVSLGLSGAWGRTLRTTGDHLMAAELEDFRLIGADFTLFCDNWENRLEVAAGRIGRHGTYALFLRTGLNLLEEGRLKVELQPEIRRRSRKTTGFLSAGVTWMAGGNITFRALVQPDFKGRDSRIVFQIYFYKRM